jgi:phospholipase/carboxylesterase
MNARFSMEQFPHVADSSSRAEPDEAWLLAELLPSTVYDVLTPALWQSATMDAGALDVAVETCQSAPGCDEVYVPENYEPNYAYPLIAWLHAAGAPNGRLERRMRLVSERNYFGVSVPIADGKCVEEQVFETVARLRRRYHLHTERIYLVGFGTAGTCALEAELSQPEWFGGIVAISAPLPRTKSLLARFKDLRGKRVLLGVSESAGVQAVSAVTDAQKLLWSAGMHVRTLECSASAESCPALLRELDRWIMQAIEQPELVC